MEAIDLVSIITIAFLGSFGHCIGMCGGIVIAYTSAKIAPDSHPVRQSLSHLAYSLGRITTYVGMGAFFGFLGSTTLLSREANATLYVLAGIAMVLTGLSLSGKIPFLQRIELDVSSNQWYRRLFSRLLQSRSLVSFYGLGILNGFLPCGFVYFFAFTAASTASPLWGAVVMLVFGLSTIPALFGLGFFVQTLQRFQKSRQLFTQLAALAVILFGIYTLYQGGIFFLYSDSSLLNCH